MDSRSVIRTTQALGALGPLFMSGIFFGASYLSIKPLLPLPISESTRIFADIYHAGGKVQAPLAVVSTLLNATSAYLLPHSRLEHGFAAASVISTSILTFTVMMPGIERMLKIQKLDGSEIQGVQKQEVVRLLTSWQRQNYLRAVLAGVSGALGLSAIMKRT